MSSTPSTSAKRSTLSSGSEKTPESGPPRAKRTYKKSCNSPSLQAFESFSDSLGQFHFHVLNKIDLVGIESAHLLRSDLERLDKKCGTIQDDFKGFISGLDKAIKDYELKKPTNLAADANSLISPENQAANRSSLSKGNNTIDETFTALNICISNISTVIRKKTQKSIYEDYSFSVEKKLKNLMKLCEFRIKSLDKTAKRIKNGIDQNEEIEKSHPFSTLDTSGECIQ